MKYKSVYVASSWRNELQPQVVEALRNKGYEVYDFKNPEPGNHGFHWSEIDPAYKDWTTKQFIQALYHPISIDGFNRDMNALATCDICVLVLPCGRSAHLELGHAAGAQKPTFILNTNPEEPELMYRMVNAVCTSIEELLDAMKLQLEAQPYPGRCPITRLPFFMELSHPDLGWVPTYGGPYDSYTIPQKDKNGEYYRERFDHDEGIWKETEWIDVAE